MYLTRYRLALFCEFGVKISIYLHASWHFTRKAKNLHFEIQTDTFCEVAFSYGSGMEIIIYLHPNIPRGLFCAVKLLQRVDSYASFVLSNIPRATITQ